MTEPGYSADDSEMRKVLAHLEDSRSELGMNDFSDKASLEGAIKLSQGVSPHENIEATVEEAIINLTKFMDVHYKQSVQAVQEFIDRAHEEIEHVTEAVNQGKSGYQKLEQENEEIFNQVGPPDGN